MSFCMSIYLQKKKKKNEKHMLTLGLLGTQFAGVNIDLGFFELALSIAMFLSDCLVSAMIIFTVSEHS